jgi:hypothetical protein
LNTGTCGTVDATSHKLKPRQKRFESHWLIQKRVIPLVSASAQVTCCFTASQAIIQVFANEANLTSVVSGDMTDSSILKTVTFDEPNDEAALAFMGTHSGGSSKPFVFAQCACTRPESNWNNAHLSSTDRYWYSPSPQTNDPNTAFVAHWYTNFYKPFGVPLKSYLTPPYSFTSPTPCGLSVGPLDNITPNSKNTFHLWMAKRQVLNAVETGGVVTCCFTANQEVLRLFINEQDVLSDVTGNLSDVHSSKTITFIEPKHDAAFAMIGAENQLGNTGSAMVQCKSTRRGSTWDNFQMTASVSNPLAVWRTWKATTANPDTAFPSYWYLNNVLPVNLATKGTTDVSYTINTDECYSVDVTHKVKPRQIVGEPFNFLWILRSNVKYAGDFKCV